MNKASKNSSENSLKSDKLVEKEKKIAFMKQRMNREEWKKRILIKEINLEE